MSDSLKSAKKKYSQQELRRIMGETKAAKQLHQPNSTVKRIESPLAKYNDLGQLTCVLCRSIVRSEAVWKVHIHSKLHKDSVEAAKQLKEHSLQSTSVERELTSSSNDVKMPTKRSATCVPTEDSVPMKKPKGILKHAQSGPVLNGALPNDFFDSSKKTDKKISSTIRTELVNIRLPERHQENNVQDPAGIHVTAGTSPDEEKLPEGFFDDPKMDAKARNQEYKDPNDEEWEKFQKEIKEASNVSMAIISEEQEESTAERQIAEIDEQIRNWSRVLYLEKKKEQVQTVKGNSSSSRTQIITADCIVKLETDADDNDDDEFDEFLDWRAKKSYK